MRNAKVFAGTLLLLQLADAWIMRTHAGWIATDRPLSWPLVALALVALVVLWWRMPAFRPPLAVAAAGFAGNLLSYAEYGRFVDVIPMRLWYSSLPDLTISGACLWLAIRSRD